MAAPGRIFKRGRSWYIDATVDGERVRRSAGASKLEARRRLEAMQRSAAQGNGYAALHDVFRAYIQSLRVRGKANSVGQAEVHLDLLERHFGRGFNAAGISRDEVDGFVRMRLSLGRSPASVNGSLRYLRAALRRAELQAPVNLLRETHRVPRILTSEQVERLVEAAPAPIDLALLLAGRAGLRHQEILHLQRRDVDLIGRTLHVSAKPEAAWSPKNHHERVVPISDRLASRLAVHLDELDDPAPAAWIFPGLDAGPRSSVSEPIRSAFRAADLYEPEAKPGLHQLRRTWASALLAKGADLETVRELGGWSSLEVVQRYLASTDMLKRRAIESLD